MSFLISYTSINRLIYYALNVYNYQLIVQNYLY